MYLSGLCAVRGLMCGHTLAEWGWSGQESLEVSQRDGASCLLLHATELKEIGDLEGSHLRIALGLL